MASSYTDLQTYRACPRLFGFTKLRYWSPELNEPMTTGELVHAGLAAYFSSQNRTKREAELAINQLVGAKMIAAKNLDSADRYEYEQVMTHSMKRAIDLLERYITYWAKDYKVIQSEPTYESGGVICHPDLIAWYPAQGVPKLSIIDFKTSYHPEERWYDISNQVDLYAYIYYLTSTHKAQLIVYDIISEQGLFRHTRPPRFSDGRRLFQRIQELNRLITSVKALLEEQWCTTTDPFLGTPHRDYTCPTRCAFFHPCWLLDTDGWDACRDYLEENYLK